VEDDVEEGRIFHKANWQANDGESRRGELTM
jgi:hypothetical protein